jgi:nucleoside permease NupC
MKYIIAIIGLIIVLALAFLASNNKKQIKYKPVLLMIVIQIALSALLLNTKFTQDPVYLLYSEESPIKVNHHSS